MMDLIVTVLFVILLMAVEHYLPWATLRNGKPLPRLAAYTLGVLALVVPLETLFIHRYISENNTAALDAALTLALTVMVGGLTVSTLHLVDGWILARRQAEESGEREKILLDRMFQHDTHDKRSGR